MRVLDRKRERERDRERKREGEEEKSYRSVVGKDLMVIQKKRL